MTSHDRDAYKLVIREAKKELIASNADVEHRVVIMKTGEHFIERFVERHGDDIEMFKKVVNAFVGMLKVRRKYYFDMLNKNPKLMEQKYDYFGHRIHFLVERGTRCQGDDNGTNTLVKFSTYYKVK